MNTEEKKLILSSKIDSFNNNKQLRGGRREEERGEGEGQRERDIG